MKKLLALSVAILATSGAALAQYSPYSSQQSDLELIERYQAGIIQFKELPGVLQDKILEMDDPENIDLNKFSDRVVYDYNVNRSDFAVGTSRDLSVPEIVSSTNAIYIPVNERNDDVYGTKNTVKTARTDWTRDSQVIDLYDAGLLSFGELPESLQDAIVERDNEEPKPFFNTIRTRKANKVETIILKDTIQTEFDYQGESFHNIDRFNKRMEGQYRRHMSNGILKRADDDSFMMYPMQKPKVVKASYINRKSYEVSPDPYFNSVANVIRFRNMQEQQ